MADKEKPEPQKKPVDGYDDAADDAEFTEKFMKRMRERAAVHGYLVSRR